MRFSHLAVVSCGLLLAACSGGGSASSTVPSGSPTGAAGGGVPLMPAGGARRPLVASACTGTGNASFIGGGYQNSVQASYSSVVAGEYNDACGAASGIDNGYDNSNDIYATYAFIGAGAANTNSQAYAVIVGGESNATTGQAAFIGSGASNGVSGEYGVVTGGAHNSASAEWATVAGGNTNTASGNGANVAGGANNVASGAHATVLGGSRNTASGAQSLAAGFNSTAETAGSFVWSDDAANAQPLTSYIANQFLARASGGYILYTDAAATSGAALAAGSGAWESLSDRNMKTNVVGVDDADVLDRVGRLPINRWSYTTEHGVRHVGPMAQDFYAAFGVGEDDRHITSIDEDGVALAAIKALRDQNAELRARQRRQERATLAKQAAMEREIARLDAAVTRLERAGR